jgi:hypothetical protein
VSSRNDISFLSEFIARSSDPISHEHNAVPGGAQRLASIKFQAPIEVVLTLEQMGIIANEMAKISVRVTPGVFDDVFLQSTGIYIRNACSLYEMMEMFAAAAGLDWRIFDDETIEISRKHSHEVKLNQDAKATQLLETFLLESTQVIPQA